MMSKLARRWPAYRTATRGLQEALKIGGYATTPVGKAVLEFDRSR